MQRFPVVVDELELRWLIEGHARLITLGCMDGELGERGGRISELAELLCGQRVLDARLAVDVLEE